MTEGTLVSNSRLPEQWTWAKLGELASFANGDRGKNYPSQSDRVDSGVPFINTGHIEPTGRLSRGRMDYITRESFEKLGAGKVRPGDIVYCLRGSTIGKTARNEFAEGAIASSLVIIRARDSRLQQFIYFYLASPIGQSLAKKFDNGSAQPNLSAKVISRYPIPLPPEDELVRICLLLTALDDKIDLNRRMNETLEAMARAIFKDWFLDFGPTRAKAEGRTPYLASELWDLFPEALDSEGNPVGWDQGILADVANSPRRGVTPADVAVDTPYIGLEHMPRRSIALSAWEGAGKVKSNKTRFHRGEILFGKLRPYFHKVGIAPLDGICSTDIVVAVPRAKEWGAFTLACLSSDEFVDYTDRTSTGTKMPRTSWKTMAQYKVCLPPEQLVRAFQGVAQPFLDRLDANVRETSALAQARDLLLPKLMSGKIRLRDNDVVAKEVA